MADRQPPPDDRFAEADDALLEELLRQSLHGGSAGRDARVDRVMAGLDDSRVVPSEAATQAAWRRTLAYRLASLAALVLIAVFAWGSGGADAQATVLRCLEQATQFGVRCYHQTTVLRRPLVGEVTRESELYVDGADRFVMRRDAPFGGGEIWLGSDGEQYWLVPPRGPVVLKESQTLPGWFERREFSDDPPMELATMLRRLSVHYDLEQTPDESIATPAGDAHCEHIVGRVQADAPLRLPATIELWADHDSGLARRMVLDWQLAPTDRGRARVTIELAPTPELPDDWFEYSGHTDRQPVRRDDF